MGSVSSKNFEYVWGNENRHRFANKRMRRLAAGNESAQPICECCRCEDREHTKPAQKTGCLVEEVGSWTTTKKKPVS